jgi:hypothetical protein
MISFFSSAEASNETGEIKLYSLRKQAKMPFMGSEE